MCRSHSLSLSLSLNLTKREIVIFLFGRNWMRDSKTNRTGFLSFFLVWRVEIFSAVFFDGIEIRCLCWSKLQFSVGLNRVFPRGVRGSLGSVCFLTNNSMTAYDTIDGRINVFLMTCDRHAFVIDISLMIRVNLVIFHHRSALNKIWNLFSFKWNETKKNDDKIDVF